MRKLKYLLLPALFTLILSPLASAVPNKCPSADEIKKAKIQYVVEYSEGKDYLAGQYDSFYYDTNVPWAVSLFLSAASLEDALSNAKKALETVSGNPTPVFSSMDGYWDCHYSASVEGQNVEVVAFTTDNYENFKINSISLQRR